jgi:hypothetical protein
MKLSKKLNIYKTYLGIPIMAILISSCEVKKLDQQNPGMSYQYLDFPEFITPVNKYFDIRLGEIPTINVNSYRLKISGSVNNPTSFSLEELKKLNMVEKTVTIECIDNPENGYLLGTAVWKGFKVFDLLTSLGIKDGASVVKYYCADGYYTLNTLEELQEREVLGALYMNGEPLLPAYGFPLRIIFPGYYGVRQPGWVVEMEVLETGSLDYWSLQGWNTDEPIDVDSKIFFPANNSSFTIGDSIRIGGAAYGSDRISSVDITVDDGNEWIPATIKRSLDEDYVWIFWEVYYTPLQAGTLTIHSRATARDGTIQPREEMEYTDGINAWPEVTISVKALN